MPHLALSYHFYWIMKGFHITKIFRIFMKWKIKLFKIIIVNVTEIFKYIFTRVVNINQWVVS